jgi:site-specific recombinase XerD
MGASEISQFLTWLAVDRQISASTQNQALSALLFLYKAVLTIEIGAVPPVVRARPPERLPVVLSREEIGAILKQLTGTERLVVMLLYGAGLRLEECLELRGRRRATGEIYCLAEGFAIAFARNHIGGVGGIPVRITFDSVDCDCE